MPLRCFVPAVALLSCLALGCSEPAPDFEFFDACDPRAVPDGACYAARRDPASAKVDLAMALAVRYIDEHPAAEHRWNWEEGVMMFAMTELYRVTGDVRVRDYYKTWIDHHLDEGYVIVWSDSCPPALSALALYIESGEPDYAEVGAEVFRFLAEDALRTDEGGISHLGALNVRTLWVDSLFMFGMNFTRWGEYQDDKSLLGEMGDQLDIFADLLQSESGMFVHAHGWPNSYDDDIYWGRGNSGVTVATADYLRARLLRHERDGRAEDILAAQIGGVLATQDADSGLWWSIVNRPGEIYLETSASALFAYGMARAYRYGLVGDEVLAPVAAAMAGIDTMIVVDELDRPLVTGISGPTGVGEFDDYARVRLEDDLSYGVGAVILALIETSGLL